MKTFTFRDAVAELSGVFHHTELWLCPGFPVVADCTDIYFPSAWRAPVILTRNGRVVAERMEKPDNWVLTGSYHTPFTGNCQPPDAQEITPGFRVMLLICAGGAAGEIK
ncbi:hypothetical protein EL09_22545 [Salmonella enterica subsp. enterica]|nr:hypothetical protein [Salmonella enterica subsp. enterica]MIF52451.1 hypothetical protein [Salmonella enterica subsp. enterica]